ncbi:RluA family pseudouridine synthase [uncultured Victivallis sp.]|uniref:RluA family pseudouridine synthase n=1 Tax=uncultured Victivallis sp. TaxID=354118 RepID=UPI0025832012|nr:RluA family pseudouridine synthase [uncultured Victivallis sp.]
MMNRKTLTFQIEAGDAGTRLDRCLSRLIPGESRSFLQRLIRDGLVKADGVALEVPRYPVRGGMSIAVELPEEESPEPAAEPFEFPILYEDDVMLVINKPAGVVVHPAAGNPTGTVVNALLGRYPQLAEQLACTTSRPGIVHRLDKDTSGCLAVAKTANAQFKLSTAFAGRETRKTYLAITRGVPIRRSGELSSLIGRHPVSRQKMAVVERNGKLAITRYRVEYTGMLDGVEIGVLAVRILTGRTHQIRVHLASLGVPVLGDAVYGGARTAVAGVERQLLHAWKLCVPHPATGAPMEFTAPPPEDIRRILERIGVKTLREPADFP